MWSITISVPMLRAWRLHLLHQPRPLDRLGETGIILDLGGDGELTTRLAALNYQRLQHGAGCVDSRGIAGWAGAKDHDFDVARRAHALNDPEGGTTVAGAARGARRILRRPTYNRYLPQPRDATRRC